MLARTLTTYFSCLCLYFVSMPAFSQTDPSQTGVKSRVEETWKHKTSKKGTERLEGGALAITSATMLAGILVGTLAMIYCYDQISAWVFAVTSLAYVVMEIINWTQYKEASDRALHIQKDVEVDKQINGFKAAEKQSKAAYKAAKNRATFTKGVAVGYTLASVVALVEGIVASAGGRTDVCLAEGEGDGGGGGGGGGAQRYSPPVKNIMKEIASIFFGEVNAVDLATGILGSIGVLAFMAGVIWALYLILDETLVTTAEKNGYVRSGVFAFFAAMAWTAAIMIDKAAGEYEKRADQYKKIRMRLEKIKNPDALNIAETKRMDIEDIEKEDAIQAAVKKKCVKGVKREQADWDQRCDCLKTKSCKKSNFPDVNFAEFETPEGLAANLSTLASMNDAVFSGNQGEANRLATKLEGERAALIKTRKKVQDLVNENLKKKGEPPIDFPAVEKAQRLELTKNLNQAMEKLTPEQRGKFEEIVGNSAALEQSLEKKDPVEYKKTNNLAKNRRAVPVKKPVLKFKLDDAAANLGLATEAAKLTDKEMSTESKFKSSDINKGDDRDLFQIIHHRYIKSYDKVLEAE